MKRALSTSAVLMLGVMGLTACSSSGTPTTPAGETGTVGISAHGLGTVTGTPDVVTVALGVQTRGPSANGALNANNQRSTALVTMLRSKGVADTDIQTSQLSVSPTQDPASGRITDYEVTNQVTATLHNIAAAGEIIDAAGEAAGDAVRVQQLSFSIADDSGLRAKARADAVRQAQAQAKQMAEAAGVRLGNLRSISETPTSAPASPRYRNLPDAAASTPVQPGSQQLTVAVDVTYDIDQ